MAGEKTTVPSKHGVRCNPPAHTPDMPIEARAPDGQDSHADYRDVHPRESREVILSFRITRSLADRIDAYKLNHKHKRLTKTEAVTDLIETGLFVVEKASSLKQPEVVKYLKENLYNVQLVDDIMEWPQDRIHAILGALAGEKERRIRMLLGK